VGKEFGYADTIYWVLIRYIFSALTLTFRNCMDGIAASPYWPREGTFVGKGTMRFKPIMALSSISLEYQTCSVKGPLCADEPQLRSISLISYVPFMPWVKVRNRKALTSILIAKNTGIIGYSAGVYMRVMTEDDCSAHT
jgi:hypothetical protein